MFRISGVDSQLKYFCVRQESFRGKLQKAAVHGYAFSALVSSVITTNFKSNELNEKQLL